MDNIFDEKFFKFENNIFYFGNLKIQKLTYRKYGNIWNFYHTKELYSYDIYFNDKILTNHYINEKQIQFIGDYISNIYDKVFIAKLIEQIQIRIKNV